MHGTPRQGAFPPHVDWQPTPTQAYYMAADPWPLAVFLHTISTPSRRQESGRPNPPTLISSPDQEERLRAARRRHLEHGRPGPPHRAHQARPHGSYPRCGAMRGADSEAGSLHVQPGGRAHRHRSQAVWQTEPA